jgi:hypothetical protein
MEFTVHNSYIILELVPQYSDFLDISQLLTQKLLEQGYVAPRLKSSLQKLYGRHYNLIDRYEISIYKMTIDLYLVA